MLQRRCEFDANQRLALIVSLITSIDQYSRARGAQSSLPSTSALVGGIVAQEVIKLVTRQYIPADNTIVYNGIQQAVGVFKL